jgi:hypothetical protein
MPVTIDGSPLLDELLSDSFIRDLGNDDHYRQDAIGTQLPCHVREPRQMQLVRDRHRTRRPSTVFRDNKIGFAAARIIRFEGVGPMQQNHHVRILLDRTRLP